MEHVADFIRPVRAVFRYLKEHPLYAFPASAGALNAATTYYALKGPSSPVLAIVGTSLLTLTSLGLTIWSYHGGHDLKSDENYDDSMVHDHESVKIRLGEVYPGVWFPMNDWDRK